MKQNRRNCSDGVDDRLLAGGALAGEGVLSKDKFSPKLLPY